MSKKYRISNIGYMVEYHPKPYIYMVEKKIYPLKYLFYYWKAIGIFLELDEAKRFCETHNNN